MLPPSDNTKPDPATYLTMDHFWRVDGEMFTPYSFTRGKISPNLVYTHDELSNVQAELPACMTVLARENNKLVIGQCIVAMLNVWRGVYTTLPMNAFIAEHRGPDPFVMIDFFTDVGLTENGDLRVSFQQYYYAVSHGVETPFTKDLDDAILDKAWLDANVTNWRSALDTGLALDLPAKDIMQGVLQGRQEQPSIKVVVPDALLSG